MPNIRWNIGRVGRAWTADEAFGRYELTPEKFEMIDGKLLWEDTQRPHAAGIAARERRCRIRWCGSAIQKCGGPRFVS